MSAYREGQEGGAPSHPQNLVDVATFTFVLNHEVRKAGRFGYCLSLLSLSPDVSPDEDNDPGLVTRLAEATLAVLRGIDLGTTLLPRGITVLLVDADLWTLPAILARITASLSGWRAGVTLSVGGSCYPHAVTSPSELVQQAIDLMTRARKDGGNRLYLPP